MLAKLKAMFKPVKAKNGAFPEQPRRYNDAVLVIRQDNEGKKLQIEASNFLALKMLGGETDGIIEKDLREFVADNVRELINDNIEFSEHGRGIDSVLNKITNFKIRAINGTELPLKIRVIRSLSSTSAAPRFQLVMNDSSLMESLEAHRENYRANMRGDEIFDKATGLVSRESVLKDFELISFYSERNHKTSCYAILKFINYDDLRIDHDEDGAIKMLKNLIKTIETTKRRNDIIGLVADGAVILILIDTPKDNIKIPIERIMAKLPKEIKAELRIYHSTVRPEVSPEEQLNACIKGLAGVF